MFKKIIVGIDGSESANKAIKVACDIAKHYEREVTLVHVPHAEAAAFALGAVAGYHAATTMPSYEEVEEAGQKILDAALAEADATGCKNISAYMPHGDAATEILAHADRISADLIVTGRRGLSQLSSFLLGGTTQRINQFAKCACLSVI